MPSECPHLLYTIQLVTQGLHFVINERDVKPRKPEINVMFAFLSVFI